MRLLLECPAVAPRRLESIFFFSRRAPFLGGPPSQRPKHPVVETAVGRADETHASISTFGGNRVGFAKQILTRKLQWLVQFLCLPALPFLLAS